MELFSPVVLDIPSTQEMMDRAGMSLANGGLGLRSASRDKVSAYWASWADALPTIRERHPVIADQLCVALQRGDGGPHVVAVAHCRELLITSGFDCPEWGDVARGLQPGQVALEDPMLGIARRGWQRGAALHVEEQFRTVVVWPRLHPSEQALLRSQSGPSAGVPFSCVPSSAATRFESQEFRVLLLRRLWCPLPLSASSWPPPRSLSARRSFGAKGILFGERGSGLVPGGQNLSRRQTVFFLPVDPRNESHRDPEYIDFSAPRLARYMHRAWKRHQDAVFWVDIDLGLKEGLVFYQTRSNAIILQGTLPVHCILQVERLKTGEMLYERRYLSPRPPPKISLRHDLNWTKGNDQSRSTVEHQPVGKLVQQSLGEALQVGSSKPIQSKPNPIGDQTGKLVEEENTSCSREIVGKRLQRELGSSDRTGKFVKCEDNRVMNVHDRTVKSVETSSHTVQEVGSLEHRDTKLSNANKFNLAIDEENIDFNISGVSNAMMKRSHSINVHNLIQQIENHPQRQALQSDLQQHCAFNLFSKESKDAIMAVGNTELCEIVDVEPKSQCRACLTYWSAGIVY